MKPLKHKIVIRIVAWTEHPKPYDKSLADDLKDLRAAMQDDVPAELGEARVGALSVVSREVAKPEADPDWAERTTIDWDR